MKGKETERESWGRGSGEREKSRGGEGEMGKEEEGGKKREGRR